MTKYLWLVTQDAISDWSIYASAVIVAETEEGAKGILPTSKMLSGSITWCSPEYVSVRYLGVAEPGLEGVICVCTPNENDKGD